MSSPQSLEDIALDIKLDGIFSPIYRQLRDEANGRTIESRPEDAPAKLRCVHYTTAPAALSIINTKRLWMRTTTCMSDFREVQHGHLMLLKFFADQNRKDRFVAALDECHQGAAQEALNLFDGWWNDIQVNTFITSFSQHYSAEDSHGRLSMWRAYGGSTGRVAIVFNVPWLSPGARALNLMFSPVTYLTEQKTDDMLHAVIQNIVAHKDFLRPIERSRIIATVFNMLRVSVTCQKHEGFHEEREWRAMYSPTLNASPLMKSSIQVIAGVPQIVYNLPLDVTVDPALADVDFGRLFDRLIIGPTQYPAAMHGAFALALSNAGIPNARERVFISNIPIRT